MPQPKKKPLTSAERARKYRERKAEEREQERIAIAAAEQLERDARDASPGPKSKPILTQLEATDAALGAMKWLKDSDGALVNQARRVSKQIDDLLEADPTATGKATSLGQLLTRCLHELGGTPTVRLQHELRSLRVAAGLDNEGGPDGPSNEGPAKAPPGGGATVTSIKRPAKRKRSAAG